MNASADWVKLFPKKYVPLILQDVLDCSANLERPPPTEKRPEEALCKAIYKRLCLLSHYRQGPIEPHIESWLPDLESRADIRFLCGRGIETYFIVEAKRLFVTFSNGKLDSLVGKYIDEGMMRFVEGRYAPHQNSSAMLAYVYDAELLKAQESVALSIKNKSAKLLLAGLFKKSLLKLSSPTYETCHRLTSKQFVLFHLFVKIK